LTGFGFFRIFENQVFKMMCFNGENGMLALVQSIPFSPPIKLVERK
jgi:hypothetical protein